MTIGNRLRQIDIRDLGVFMSIFETHCARDTADSLGISQPTVSYCLKRLRESFDDELFVMRKGAMTPTSKATAIAPYVQSAIDSVQRCTVSEAGLQAETRRRSFRLQAPEYFELFLLPPMVEAIALPCRVTLETERLGPELPVERLLAGKLDLAFGFGPGYHRIHPELEWRSLLGDDFLCLTSVPNLGGDRLTLDEFLAHPHVHPTPWDATTNMVDGWLETIGRQRLIIARANSYQACLAVIERAPLIFSVPRRLLPLLRVPRGVRCLEPPLGFPTFTLDLIWSRRRAADSKWLRDRFAPLVADLAGQETG